MKECTIELKISITKVIDTPDDPVRATIAADSAIKAIINRLNDCDQVKVESSKQFQDFEGDK